MIVSYCWNCGRELYDETWDQITIICDDSLDFCDSRCEDEYYYDPWDDYY